MATNLKQLYTVALAFSMFTHNDTPIGIIRLLKMYTGMMLTVVTILPHIENSTFAA